MSPLTEMVEVIYLMPLVLGQIKTQKREAALCAASLFWVLGQLIIYCH